MLWSVRHHEGPPEGEEHASILLLRVGVNDSVPQESQKTQPLVLRIKGLKKRTQTGARDPVHDSPGGIHTWK